MRRESRGRRAQREKTYVSRKQAAEADRSERRESARSRGDKAARRSIAVSRSDRWKCASKTMLSTTYAVASSLAAPGRADAGALARPD